MLAELIQAASPRTGNLGNLKVDQGGRKEALRLTLESSPLKMGVAHLLVQSLWVLLVEALEALEVDNAVLDETELV